MTEQTDAVDARAEIERLREALSSVQRQLENASYNLGQSADETVGRQQMIRTLESVAITARAAIKES